MKKLFVIILFSLLFLAGCKKEEKSNIITYTYNYENEIFKAQLDSELITSSIYEKYLLLFEPILEDERSYLSVISETREITAEECMKKLKDYKATLEEEHRTALLTETTYDDKAFLNYNVIGSDGFVTTIYSKVESKNDKNIMVIYFSKHSKKNETNNAFRSLYDSITIK